MAAILFFKMAAIFVNFQILRNFVRKCREQGLKLHNFIFVLYKIVQYINILVWNKHNYICMIAVLEPRYLEFSPIFSNFSHILTFDKVGRALWNVISIPYIVQFKKNTLLEAVYPKEQLCKNNCAIVQAKQIASKKNTGCNHRPPPYLF